MKSAIVIGCSHYDDARIADLRYADNDAQRFAGLLSSACGIDPSQLTLLHGTQKARHSQPTRANILRALSDPTSGTDNLELLFFFFSGHGFHSSKDNSDYFLPQDCVATALEHTAIRFSDITAYLESWQARHTVLFMDACRANVESAKGPASPPWTNVDVSSLCPDGMVTFCSCRPLEASYESELLKSGIFTAAVEKALDQEGRCATVSELNDYLVRHVPLISRQCSTPIQNPFTEVKPLDVRKLVLVTESKLYEWRANTRVGRELRTRLPTSSKKAFQPPNSNTGLMCAMDFGTSFSTVAALDESGMVNLVRSWKGRTLIPSVVTFDTEMNYRVGWLAEEDAYHRPERAVRQIKRKLGLQREFNIDGVVLTPEVAASLVIRSLKEQAEEYFSARFDRVLAAVPANYSISQSSGLLRAFELAGLEVVRLIGEPTAASVLLESDIQPAEDYWTMVIDLGGGTLDVAIVAGGEGVVELYSIAGDNELGSVDYDEALVQYVKDWLVTKFGVEQEALSTVEDGQIRREAERAKIELSDEERTSIIIRNLELDDFGLQDIRVPVDRDIFRNITRPLNSRLEGVIDRAVEIYSLKIGRGVDSLSSVLLAGQGSKVFTVKEVLAAKHLQQGIITRYQESAVVRGLCRYTGVLYGRRDSIYNDLLILDAVHLGIGLRCASRETLTKHQISASEIVILGLDDENDAIAELIEGTTNIPTRRSERFAVRSLGRSTVSLRLVERIRRDYFVDIGALEIAAGGADFEIEATIDVDENRTIVAEIRKVHTGEVSRRQVNNRHLRSGWHSDGLDNDLD